MGMVTRIAFGNMKYHKSRNILIGIAIFLTTLLLFLVPNIGKNLLDGQTTVVNDVYPSWHALYRDVDADTVQKLSAHHDVLDYGLRSDAGVMVAGDAQVSMIYMDEQGLSLYNIALAEGTLPQKENEIVVSKGILKALDQDGKIGSTITVPYQIERDGGLDLTGEQEFVISGFFEDSAASEEQQIYTALVSKDFLEKEVPVDQIRYRFLFQVQSNPHDMTDELETSIYQLAEQFDIPENNVRINDEYLMANYVDPAVMPAIVLIMLIIIFAGVITIYSIYYVGMTDRVQEFGKLKAIGATKSQIRQIVLREGMGIALLAVPLGLLVGTISSKAIFLELISMYQKENERMSIMRQLLEEHSFSLFTWWIYFLAAGIAFLTVYLSLCKPMKIASRISEMEAIRYQSEENNGSQQSRRRHTYTDLNVFRLSRIYLAGNRKKSVITIVSMGITGVFLMVIATVLSCANPRESANSSVLGQYVINTHVETGNKEHPEREWSSIIKNNPLTEELKQQIENLDGIESVSVFDEVKVTSDAIGGEREGVIGVPEEFAQKLMDGIIEGNVTYEELKSGDKMIVDNNILYWYPDLKLGDTIELAVQDGSNTTRKVEIAAIGDYPIGFTDYSYFMMAKEGAQKLCPDTIHNRFQIFANEDYNETTYQQIKSLLGGNEVLELDSWQANFEEWKSALSLTSGACYAFLGILGAICIMNMINTMINSVHVRKKEIGMMQAIGMTDKQLVAMLQQEGLFYTAGTLILSIGLGSLIGYPVFLYAKENGMFNITNYHYPITAAVVISLILILIQIILAIGLGRSVKKESLIERIRFSE